MKKAFLFLLSLLAVVGIQAQTSPYAGNEVAAGDFFLYNVESGLWLQNNDGRNTGDWNTRGAVGSYGFEFGFSVEGEGWKLDPKFGHNHSMNSSNFYLDTGDGVTVWTLEPKTVEGVTNAYTIKAGDQILGLDENENIAWTDAKSTWQLVTRADRLAYLKANASEENPIDATFLIMDPGFANENDRASFWKWEQDGGNRDDVRWYWCRRSYAIWNSNSFKISQQIADIPNGTYKLTVKGYYRDGDRDQVAARRGEGNERILASYFINSDKAPFMSILDGASEEWVDGMFYYPGETDNAPYGHYPDNADAFNRIFQDYPEAYQNAGVVSVVTTKSMTIGIEKLAKNDRDWLAWDDFRLTYMGSNIDIAAMQEALQKAINQAKEWDASNTSTALATALNTAISESEAMLTSTDEDELAAATAAVSEALSKAQAVNVSSLKDFIVFGEKWGVDLTAANAAVENATTADEVNVALLNLQGAIKVKAIGGASDIYAGSAPAAGEFYLFNIGTGMWLNQGSDWDTHAAVDQAGLLVTFEENGDGFIFRTPWGTFNNSPYTDTPANTVYKFQAVEGMEGVYNILEGNRLLGWNPQGHTDGEKYWGSLSNTEGADPADPNFQWKLVTKAERDELLAKATKAAPVDATYLISNPSLHRQPGYDVWKKEVDGGNGGARVDNKGGDRSPDFAWEYYDTNSFKFYQELEGLAPGLYEVSATAFYRDGNGGYQAGVVNDGGELLQLAYLFGNEAQAPLPNIASVTDFVPGVATQSSSKGSFPNWPREAIEYFEHGAYKVTVKAVVGEDGKLAIGIAKDSKANDGDWVVLDNFRLTYLGYDETEMNYERSLASIEDGKTYRVFTTDAAGAKLYLNTAGKLVADELKAATFAFNAVKAAGTLFETGWNLGCKFTNPALTNGSSGDIVQKGGINVGGNDRNDWERQVFFKNANGKFAVRSTNANSANWGANTYWDLVEFEELPAAGYSLNPSYVWEIEENVDNRPEAFAKTQTWAAQLQAIEGLVQDADKYISNAKDPDEGSYAALLDGDYSTFFHSTWHASNDPQADHYLQAELPEAAQDFYIYFKKRSQNNNNRPTKIIVSGSNDGENFVEITTISEGLPTGATPIDYMSAEINGNEAYKYLRFTVPETNNGAKTGDHVFFTFSEFYILPASGLTPDAAPFMVGDYTDLAYEDVEAINALDEEIAAAKAQLDLAADLESLHDLADKLIDQIEATETYDDPTESAANRLGTVENLRNATYTSKEDIDFAKDQIVEQAQLFFGAIEAKADIDITDWFIVNPTPIAHQAMAEGWEGDNFGDASDGVSEYWNRAAVGFHQTISLPAGSYKLTAIALTRTDMEGKIYAGENSVNIAQATPEEANLRSQAAAWFAAGNGINVVPFEMAEAGEITIGLKADEATGDHWTVWQSFKLELTAPVAVPDVVLNAPTWSAEEGTQAEPNMLPVGSTLKITYTADNLEANGLTADDVKVKITVMVSGDLPENVMNMQSPTVHRVLPTEPFEIPLGETDFPVALKEGYVYQNIAVVSAQLVKGEEVIATYAGAPVQLHWVGLSAPAKGDADGDGSVDVADHAVIRDAILSNAPYNEAFDINEDTFVDIADLTGVVNIILYGDWQGEAETAVRGNVSADVLTLNYVNGRYVLVLNTGRAYNGFQMDLNVPEGMTLVSQETNGSHSVMTSRLANGKTRVLVYSTDNNVFEGSEVLYLNVVGQGTLTAENIIFSDANANSVRLALGDATGINGIAQNETNTIYDLSGRKADTMRRGVNIVRSADGKTKKVLK